MEPGELLGGRYRLVERLGAGGMAVVWRGFDEVLGRQVAVKLLASRLATDGTFRQRIRAEARAAGRLCHPYIATVHDYGESLGPDGVGLPYVVMELVEGESLASRLTGGRALPWRQAVAVGAQVAAALADAHAHGVVHRDVTPGNVMLTVSGAKVVDFGISALIGEQDQDTEGRVLGTPAYLAPERIDGHPVVPATDVYALGLLLYRALTGRLPWPADTPTEALRANRYAEPPPLPPIDGLPAEVAALYERCLEKDPADRPSSAQAARELAAVLGGVPVLDFRHDGRHNPLGVDRTDPLVPAVPTAVDAGARGRRPGRRGAVRSRTELVLVGLALLLVSGLAWSGSVSPAAGDDGGRGWSYALGAGAGAGVRHRACVTEYRLQQDRAGAFTATVTVKNTGGEPFEDWELAFELPGDQWVTGVTGGTWSQHERRVTARGEGDRTLPPGAAAELTFAGGYRGVNPLPGAFAVNGTACTPLLVATPVAGNGGGTGAGVGRGNGPDKGTAPGKGSGKGKGGKSAGGDH